MAARKDEHKHIKDNIMKDKLLKDIKDCYLNSSNSCVRITLGNWYNTVSSLPQNQINFDWYYQNLSNFKK